MSPYAQTLAQARLDALQALQQALQDAETPDEKRRCAVAIFNAPDPCDLDDSIEWVDDNSQPEDWTPASATGSPSLRRQPVPDCNTIVTPPEAARQQSVPPAAGASPAAGAACNLDMRLPAAPDFQNALSAPTHPNSYPAYPELAHLTDDQIHQAHPDDLRQLIAAARCQTHPEHSSTAAPGP